MSAQESINLSGTLNRVMAMGGESTGWALQLDESSKIGGKQVRELEVAYPNQAKLREWNGKRVKVTGTLGVRRGVERGDRTVLEIATIEVAGVSQELAGTKWLLEDLAGASAVAGVPATLEFQSLSAVTGNGSCNGFGANVKIDGPAILFREIRMTRKACAVELMRQERRYLELLGAAERWELADGKLAIYAKGAEKPLRFLKRDRL
jgi:heat shock protein HslJ